MVPTTSQGGATATWLAMVLFCFGCGRSGFELVVPRSFDAGPSAPDASVDGGPLGVAAPLFYIDAENVSGAGDPGSGSCPASAPSLWLDLVTGSPGDLLNFADPACGGQSGWRGSGSASDPHRLQMRAAAQQGIPFGTIAATGSHTVQAWVRWSGGGVANSTGTGGVEVYPLVSRGVSEIEESDVDINYFLAISSGSETIVGEFEGNIDHQNHPFEGNTVLDPDRWYHLAISYDHSQQALYVNGVLDASRPESDPTPTAALSILSVGSGYESDGMIDGGFFDGDIALVRIFGRALSAAEIRRECEAFAPRFMGLSCDP